MYSIVFVKATEFNVRISPTLCEQYIYEILSDVIGLPEEPEPHLFTHPYTSPPTFLGTGASCMNVGPLGCIVIGPV